MNNKVNNQSTIMSGNNNNSIQDNAPQEEHQITNENLITYLRDYFTLNDHINNPIQIHRETTNTRSYTQINVNMENDNQTALGNGEEENNQEEDKDDNDNEEELNNYHSQSNENEGVENNEDEENEGIIYISYNDIDYIAYESPNDDEDDEFNNEGYVDFRVYPLNIDWAEIEDSDLNYFDILQLHGYFGTATLTGLSNVKGIELFVNDFIHSFLAHYYRIVIEANLGKVIDFIIHLPSLKSIHHILQQDMLIKKEMVCMKIVIDIYEHYINTYERALLFNEKESYIATARLFYNSLSDKDIKFIYDVLHKEMKKTLMIITKLGGKVMKHRQQYLKYYDDMKNDISHLIGGVKESRFIL